MPRAVLRTAVLPAVLVLVPTFVVVSAALPARPAAVPTDGSAPAPQALADGKAAAGAPRPILFAANVGQAAEGALFTARGGGMVAAFAQDALWFQLAAFDAGSTGGTPAATRAARVALTFVDAATEMAVAGEDEAATPVAHLGGRATGRTPVFRRVRYRGVQPGIDVVVRGDGGAPQYDVHVAPGADLAAVSFELAGASALRLASDGSLVATTPAGDFVQGAPQTYEIEKDGARRALPSRFRLLGGVRYGFAADGRDASRELVVDPVLSYSSYLGGSGVDVAYGVATAGFSEAYVVGSTLSTDFPLTLGAVDPTTVQTEAFVARVNFAGTMLNAATYLGGSGDDVAEDVAVGADGTIFVVGRTTSANFPTTPGAFDATYGGGGDAFLLRLTNDGTALVFSTFAGGPGADALTTIALATDGSPLVGGTSSGGFPTSGGSVQPTYAGGGDGVLAKFATGGAFLGGTYLGGGLDDAVTALAIDPSTDDLLVAGTTRAGGVGATPGAWLATPPGGMDGFASRIAADLSAVQWSTFLGGAADDAAYGVGTDGVGTTFVAGRTASADFPTTAGSFDQTFDGPTDAFAVALDAAGAAPVFATFVGGTGDDAATDLRIDVGWSVHLVGETNAADFPATFDGHQPTPGGGVDGFYAKLDFMGTFVEYGTFLGGAGSDRARALALDARGGVFVAGEAEAGFPTSPGALDETYGGQTDAFVFACVFCFAKPSVFDLGGGCAVGAPPTLNSTNGLLGQFFTMTLSGMTPGTPAQLWFSGATLFPLVFGGCSLHVDPYLPVFAGFYAADAAGEAAATFHVTPDSFCCGLELAFQAFVLEPAGPALSNGVRIVFGG
jgi:hypothetical protein